MKTILFILLIIIISASVKAQLTNTKWKGKIQAEIEIKVTFNFKTDTIEVLNSADGSGIETLIFSTKDSVLSLQKIYGQSDCDGSGTGMYKFEIKDEALYITLIDDNCGSRSSVLNNTKWVKAG